MREMRDSGVEWIGQIPATWSIRRLKRAISTHSGGLWGANTAESEQDVFCVRVADFDYLHLRIDIHDNMTIRSYSQKAVIASAIKDGDVLLEKSGGGETTPVGRTVLFKSNTDMMCSNFIEYLRINNDYLPEFITYWLSSAYVNGYSKRNIKQTTGIQNIDVQAFLDEVVVELSLNEQRKITEYLNDRCAEIDALIAAKEKSNALLKERRQSIIYEAVTKGLNPDVPMKDSGIAWIGSIPETWRVAPLKRFATIRSGLTLGKKYPDGTKLVEYPYLRVANVQGEYTDLTDIATVSVTESEAELYALHAGELLMTEGGDRDKLGRGCVWEGQISPCLHQNHVFALTTNEELNIYYVDYLTTSDVGRNYFDFTAKKTTNLASTNATTILAFPIPIPCRKEQDAIVSYLREKCAEIDSIISANEIIIAKLKEYRQSVIYEAVTGKIEV